jgi:chromosome segregation ATPase
VRHHAAQHHAAALVEIYTSVADAPASPLPAATGNVAQLAQDRFALEHRAVRAEWEVARLRREVQALRAQRDRLRARVERLRVRLSRSRERVQRLRRQRDRQGA